MKMTYMIDIYNVYEIIYFILFCTSFPGFIILVHYSKSSKLIKDIGKLIVGTATAVSGVDAALNLSNKYKNSNNGSNNGSNSSDNNKDDKKKDDKSKDESNDNKKNTTNNK
jgi:Sec-independent protein translocase protein TatA